MRAARPAPPRSQRTPGRLREISFRWGSPPSSSVGLGARRSAKIGGNLVGWWQVWPQRAASERPIALPRAGGRARARGARAGMAARAMRHTAAWRRRPPRWAAVLLLLLSHLGCTVAQPAETVCGHPATVQQFAYQDGYQLTEFVLVKTIAVGVGSSIAPPTLCARFIRSPPRRPQTAHRGPHASLHSCAGTSARPSAASATAPSTSPASI